MARPTVLLEDVVVKAVTESALLVVYEETEAWIPLSQCGEETDVASVGDRGTVELPEWFALEKELI
jgi:hypothetical protein